MVKRVPNNLILVDDSEDDREIEEADQSRVKSSPRTQGAKLKPVVERSRIRTIQRNRSKEETQDAENNQDDQNPPPQLPPPRSTVPRNRQASLTPQPEKNTPVKPQQDKTDDKPQTEQLTPNVGASLSSFTVVLTGQIESCQVSYMIR
jgi:hypothetical protein